MEAGAYEEHLKAASSVTGGGGGGGREKEETRQPLHRERSAPSGGGDTCLLWFLTTRGIFILSFFLGGLHTELKEDRLGVTSERCFGLFGEDMKRND